MEKVAAGNIAENGLWVKWRDCPDCGGRGWFLIQPFVSYTTGNHRQCDTCLKEYEKFQAANSK